MTRQRKSELREVLSRIWWSVDKEKCFIVILHRGAPKNRKVLAVKDIDEIKAGYLFVGDLQIPIHRIIEIICNGKTLWKRKKI